MSHYITIPIDPNGIVNPDEEIDDIISTSMSDAFGTTDVFIYSHGWWTTADSALKQYNIATTALTFRIRQHANLLARPASVPFLIGIHWPSMWVDDPTALLNKFEPFSFYGMEKRADDVGEEGLYAILRLLFRAVALGKGVRFNLFGHSFGCKVVCSALQKLAENDIAVPPNLFLNVILLQAAFGTDCLEPDKPYGRIIPKFSSGLRLLISKSAKDDALGKAFPVAHCMNFFAGEPRTALGATGPSDKTLAQFQQKQSVAISFGATLLGTCPSPTFDPVLVVADLTPVHSDPQNKYDGGWGGHHSDIFRPEIYDLMSWFLFGQKEAPKTVEI